MEFRNKDIVYFSFFLNQALHIFFVHKMQNKFTYVRTRMHFFLESRWLTIYQQASGAGSSYSLSGPPTMAEKAKELAWKGSSISAQPGICVFVEWDYSEYLWHSHEDHDGWETPADAGLIVGHIHAPTLHLHIPYPLDFPFVL